MKYTVDYFIKKFDKIPEKYWTTGSYVEGVKKCALGHCGKRNHKPFTKESNSLNSLLNYTTLSINDNGSTLCFKYHELGDTPKERILNVLLLVKIGLFSECFKGTK